MIKGVTNFVARLKKEKKLFENFLSLYLLQATNYLLPLITFPYLSRVLGPDKFGLISFSTAFVTYFISITDYGFNLSATKQIAISRNDPNKLNEIFSAVTSIKLILFIISFLIFNAIIFNVDKFSSEGYLYFLTFWLVLGSVLFPVWLFQGMQEMKYITILNFFLRVVFTLGVFLFVKADSDYLLVPALNSLGAIMTGIASLIIVKVKFRLRYFWAGFDVLKFYLVDGWYIFSTSILTTIYNQSNIFLLGIFTNNTIVGYFAIADKIKNLFLTVFTPLLQTLYPYLSNLFNSNIKEYAKKHFIISKIFITLAVLLFGIILTFHNEITILISGPKFLPSVKILRILMFSILINGIGHLYTTLFLIVKGDNAKVFKYFSYSSLVYIVLGLLVFLVGELNEISLSLVLLISEFLVVILSYMNFNRWKKGHLY